MKRYLLTLCLAGLAALAPLYAAITGGLRVNTDTTGTNTFSTRVTVTGQTNLNAGAVNATNAVNVGTLGQPAYVTLSSTNGTYTVVITVLTNGALQFLGNALDDLSAGPVFRFNTTNSLSNTDIVDFQNNGTNVASIYYNGFFYGRGLFVSEPFDGSSEYMEMNPGGAMNLVNGTNDVLMEFQSEDGSIGVTHDSTNTFKVVGLDSGYTGTGNFFLSDDGTYKATTNTTTLVSSNIYTTNLYVTNIYSTTIVAMTNQVDEMTVTNTLTSYGNSYFSNLYTLNLVVSNNITGTIDGTSSGLVLKQRKSLKLQYPRRIDGTGCTYSNTNDYTAVLFMVPRFSATGATNANWAQWAFRVPADLDTTADLTASLTVRLAGADTSDATYTVGVVSIANSSPAAGTPANYVTLTVAGDGSGADGDVESVNNVTLTGWASALTANQWALVQLQRDGGDASAVAQDALELEIFYVSSQ